LITADDADALVEEVKYFHRRVFKSDPEPDTIRRYAAANLLCLSALPSNRSTLIRKLVSKKIDVEAVEVVWRLRDPRNPLTLKFQILCYLAEVKSRHMPRFVNLKPGFFRGVAHLMLSTTWGLIKLAKGRFLIWRHGLDV
jgi:hypothetical protein